MTYKQAYDKIIDAYFKDEIKPNSYRFCFCGNLEGNDDWRYNSKSYSVKEYYWMEEALFSSFPERKKLYNGWWCFDNDLCNIYDLENSLTNYEDNLFAGMCAALEVLKQIHIDRGEVIDQLPTFSKRVFSDVLKMVK